jgi:hypothetical protein
MSDSLRERGENGSPTVGLGEPRSLGANPASPGSRCALREDSDAFRCLFWTLAERQRQKHRQECTVSSGDISVDLDRTGCPTELGCATREGAAEAAQPGGPGDRSSLEPVGGAGSATVGLRRRGGGVGANRPRLSVSRTGTSTPRSKLRTAHAGRAERRDRGLPPRTRSGRPRPVRARWRGGPPWSAGAGWRGRSQGPATCAHRCGHARPARAG